MMKGVENVFKVGVEYGAQLALDNQQAINDVIEVKTGVYLHET